MPRRPKFRLCFLGLLLPLACLQAVEDPSGDFLKAYTAYQMAERLESEGRPQPALAKLRLAAGILDQLRQENPDWQPLVVDYRARKVRERMDALQSAVGTTPVPPEPDPTPEPPPPLPPPTPGLTVVPPAPDPTPIPNANIVAPATPPPPAPSATPHPAIAVARDATLRLRQLEGEVETAREVTRAARQERDRFAKLLGESQAKLQDAAARIDQTRTSEAELRAQIAQLQEALREATARADAGDKMRAELERMHNALLDAEADREVADEENTDLARELARVRTRSATVAKERDQALTELTKAREAARDMDKLIGENAELSRKLSEAEKAIAGFKADQPLKAREISGLKDEVAGLKEQLAIAQAQSLNYQGTVAQLQQQLEEANRSVAQLKGEAAASEDAKKVAQENDLLRNILTRELREQARREQARKLAIEELAKLESQSDILVEQLDLLAQPIYRLSKDELALLRAPDITLPEDPGSASVSLALAARKQASTTGNDTSSAPSVQFEARPNVPKELEPLAREARALFERAEYREAEKRYEELLAKAPNNLHALSNLGVTRFRAGKLKAAELTLEKAVAIAPEDPFCLSTLGIVYYRQSRFDDAVNVLTKAIALDPKNAVAHNHLGITASQKGWQEAAEKELQAALELNPNYADAHFNLAVVYASSSPPSKELARRHYRRAVDLGTEPDPNLEKLLQ